MKVTSNLAIVGGVALLAVATLFGLDAYGKASRSAGYAGALNDPRVARYLVDTPEEAYRIWKQRRVHGRSLLFVAGRWVRLPVEEIVDNPPLSRPYPLTLYRIPEVQEEQRLNARTFLYLAALNGIARRIVAILDESGYAEMREVAGAAKNSRLGAREVYLTHEGFPRFFTTAGGFRASEEPVLFYLDASYFQTGDPDELYRRLTAGGIKSDCVVLCANRGDGTVGERGRQGLARFARLIGLST
jgi:hypothetical protein